MDHSAIFGVQMQEILESNLICSFGPNQLFVDASQLPFCVAALLGKPSNLFKFLALVHATHATLMPGSMSSRFFLG
jgi:hypothetical protein